MKIKVKKPRDLKTLFGYSLIGIMSVSTILPIIFIVLLITIKGLNRIDLNFLTEVSSSMETGGIFAPIYGTVVLTFFTMLFAIPLGVLAAIYMAEYAKKGKLFRVLELTIVNLAGIPSIVYGLFGLGIFVMLLNMGVSVLAGALTLACLVLPIIITISYQSIIGVPRTLREASLALGASKLQTIYKVVIPTALPGILTGVILSTARVAGETAPVLFTAAAYFLPNLPTSVFDKTMLLSYHLYAISTQVTGISDSQKFGVTFVLIALVLLLNASAILVRNKLRSRLGQFE